MMKKFVMCVAMAMMTLAAVADDVHKALKVTNGEQVTWLELSDSPRLTFADGKVLVVAGETQLELDMSNGVSVAYMVKDTATDNVDVVGATIAIEDNRIAVSGAKAGERLALYSVDGQMVAQTVVDVQGNAVLTMSAKAMYILKVGDLTIKITH